MSFSEKLGVDFALVHKEHPRGKGSRTRHDKSTSLVSQFKQNNEVPLFAPKASPASPDTSPEDLDSEIPTSLHINVPFKQLDTNILALSPSTLEIVANLRLVGDVSGRTVVLVDDIVDTCSTLIKAASLCLLHGASRVWAIVTHGIFSANALDLLQASSIEQIIVSSSLPQATTEILNLKFPKLKIVDVAPLFAEAIRRTHYGESVSLLFDRVPI